MAITDPTIDPVTGLPVLDTSGIVQQIPLGRQTVDYAGWNATAQPTRTPLYPDDVIPVFANVQGQHPQTGNAQNVGTDGHNRLLVSGDGGGGGGFTWPAALQYSQKQVNLSSGGSLSVPIASAVSTVYRFIWTVVRQDTSQEVSGGDYLAIYLQDVPTGDLLTPLDTIKFTATAATGYIFEYVHSEAAIVAPIPLSIFGHGSPVNMALYFDMGMSAPIDTSLILWYA